KERSSLPEHRMAAEGLKLAVSGSAGSPSSHRTKSLRLLLGGRQAKHWPRSGAATTSATQRFRGSKKGLVSRPAPRLRGARPVPRTSRPCHFGPQAGEARG